MGSILVEGSIYFDFSSLNGHYLRVFCCWYKCNRVAKNQTHLTKKKIKIKIGIEQVGALYF